LVALFFCSNTWLLSTSIDSWAISIGLRPHRLARFVYAP
jgi:hypothetical protein